MGMCVGWRMVGQKRYWSILQPGYISMLSAVQKAQPDLGPWMPSCESHVLSPPISTLTGDVTWFKPIYANFACMEESGCEKWLLKLTIDLETSHTTDNWPAHFLSKVSATVTSFGRNGVFRLSVQWNWLWYSFWHKQSRMFHIYLPILIVSGDVTQFKPIYDNFACMEDSECQISFSNPPQTWVTLLLIDLHFVWSFSYCDVSWPSVQ